MFSSWLFYHVGGKHHRPRAGQCTSSPKLTSFFLWSACTAVEEWKPVALKFPWFSSSKLVTAGVWVHKMVQTWKSWASHFPGNPAMDFRICSQNKCWDWKKKDRLSLMTALEILIPTHQGTYKNATAFSGRAWDNGKKKHTEPEVRQP